jgi:hypothetical protein
LSSPIRGCAAPGASSCTAALRLSIWRLTRTGAFGLGPGEDDAYRIELDAASRAIAEGTPPHFGRADAVEQAVVIETVRRAAHEGAAAGVPDVTALAATSGQASASAGERDHQ